jgi:hypothetical protein
MAKSFVVIVVAVFDFDGHLLVVGGDAIMISVGKERALRSSRMCQI